MSELRYNRISREWVIIATERAKRPEDFIKAKEKKVIPEYKENCPFCAGNEAKTPSETFRIGDQKSWKVRSVFNLFGALSPNDKPERKTGGMNIALNGFGSHEVIIEHPKHNTCIPLMTDDEVENIIKTYKQRYISIGNLKGIESIIIFKNHGLMAGCSLEHPHSQLVATPIVPPQIRGRLESAMSFFDVMGQCIFCKTLEDELKSGERIVHESEKFVSFMPYAGGAPFMTWIFPRRHMPSFDEINDQEVRDLATHLKCVLQKLYYGLDNPDYNFTIRSVPVREKGTEYFHWYISIIPRVSQPAGFELGSGIFINTSLPEQSAAFLRQVNCR